MTDLSNLAMTILVETKDGVGVREVPHARPLLESVAGGTAAEDATRSAVVRWSLPDFVFLPAMLEKGSAQREIGDALIVHRHHGLIVQIKHREAVTDRPSRESSWFAKSIKKAVAQVNGTYRALQQHDSLELSNLRGRVFEVAPSLNWASVVVLDHPAPPEGTTPDVADAKVPTVALLRRDWEFLFDQLCSTYAVIGYINRVAALDSVDLGHEPARYYELAANGRYLEVQIRPIMWMAGLCGVDPVLLVVGGLRDWWVRIIRGSRGMRGGRRVACSCLVSCSAV